jgi:hypothetical protein
MVDSLRQGRTLTAQLLAGQYYSQASCARKGSGLAARQVSPRATDGGVMVGWRCESSSS